MSYYYKFILLELLVVISIINILITLLGLFLFSIREIARRTSCQNNLCNIGISMASYAGDNYGLLLPFGLGENGTLRFGNPRATTNLDTISTMGNLIHQP